MTRHVHDQLGAYVDDELAPNDAASVADHLTTCAECSAAYETMLTTVATLRETLVSHTAPDVLRARVRAALRDAARSEATQHDVAQRVSAQRVSRMSWAWRAAASLTLVALSSGATLVVTGGRRDGERLRDEVLASHIRSLMPDHLTDVRSSDQHNVKPWFNGRLDYSPTVPRLDEQGFPLLGGRLDYVAGRPVAVVVYGRRQHVINVYSWPTPGGDAGVSGADSHGYHALRWRDAGVEHWAVSDLNVAELWQLVSVLRASR
jgi:anti-sigma factor RsiW